jgi:hypothetical protein
MENNVSNMSLRQASARLNTLVRFARWSEAREQSSLVKSLVGQCQDAEVLAMADAALKNYRRNGGMLQQLRFLLVDALLIALLVAPFWYAGEWCLVSPELTIIAFLAGAAVVAVVSATQRGNAFLADSRYGRWLSELDFSHLWFT